MMENNDINIEAAMRNFNNLKKAQKKYRETHKDKMNEISRRHYHKKKMSDPEFLKKQSEKKKEAYHKKKLCIELPDLINN